MGQVRGDVRQVLRDPGLPLFGQDPVLEEVVRRIVLDVREIALPEGGDDVVVLPGPLGDGLDDLEEIEELLALEAPVEVEGLHPVLEEEERQALDGRLVDVSDFVGEDERVLANVHFQTRQMLEESFELAGQGLDEGLDGVVVGGVHLHGRNGVGHRQEKVLDLAEADRKVRGVVGRLRPKIVRLGRQTHPHPSLARFQFMENTGRVKWGWGSWRRRPEPGSSRRPLCRTWRGRGRSRSSA